MFIWRPIQLMTAGVYQILNKVNGRRYIAGSVKGNFGRNMRLESMQKIGSFEFDGETYYHYFDDLSIYFTPSTRCIDLDPGMKADDVGILDWDSKDVFWISGETPLDTRKKLLTKVKELNAEISNLIPAE
jgi:hypothetical protein